MAGKHEIRVKVMRLRVQPDRIPKKMTRKHEISA
jgi:hypothetical protein